MPRFWAEAYRGEKGQLRARIFRAPWLRPWRATHVMEAVVIEAGPHGWDWAVEGIGGKLHDFSGGADAAADRAGHRLLRLEVRKRRLEAEAVAWTPIVPTPQMRLRSGGGSCLGPDVCGMETDHVLGCPVGQLGTGGVGPR